ncbi:MAG TPA: choice-of-anchor tandem repeat GloVer-containing protein [Terriglobales bacterium]|nr:choice-of-anchor tandem repeat GloVer-containing protein [Terriglobales bacterium]
MPRNRLFRHLTTHTAVLAFTLTLANLTWAGSKYKVLYSFTGGEDGGGVHAGVAFDDKGNLYGTTSGGGAQGEGTAFELTRNARGKWSEAVLYSFCSQPRCSDGASPHSTPVFDANGNLYGTTNGTSFELSPGQGGWNFSVIYEAGSASGYAIDGSGNLYGADGGVWELSRGANGWSETFLHIFCSRKECRDGDNALAPPTLDAMGNLYGTTEFGGGNNAPECSIGCGVIYQVQAVGGGKWKYRVLHRFAAFPNDGLMPQAGVTVDGKGNVYGTTLYSGTSSGTVFELSPQQNGSWKETILYNFPNAGKNGGAPVGAVTFDKLGNLYGTASAGGDPTCSCGVVFKMTPQANGKWSYSVLHRFKGTDGYGPGYNLIFDQNYKHLYGTTAAGGSGGYGVVYEITP